MINQITKGKVRQEKPRLKVMHIVDKNGDGTFSIDSNAPKLREAVGPDVVQQAEETAHKPVMAKLSKASKPSKTEKDKPKDEKDDVTGEQHPVLKALHDLGGKAKDIHTMDIAKKLGFDKTRQPAPRAPVRAAMERLHALHYVTSKKEGVKYSFRITDKGTEALKTKPSNPAQPVKDKEAARAVKPASNPSSPERPANTDVQC